MTEDSNDTRRRIDDQFMRKLVVALVSVIIAQGLSFVYLVGSISNQVSTNKQDIHELKNMHGTLISIETQMQSISRNMSRFTVTMEKVSLEQERRSTIIRRAENFLNRQDGYDSQSDRRGAANGHYRSRH